MAKTVREHIEEYEKLSSRDEEDIMVPVMDHTSTGRGFFKNLIESAHREDIFKGQKDFEGTILRVPGTYGVGTRSIDQMSDSYGSVSRVRTYKVRVTDVDILKTVPGSFDKYPQDVAIIDSYEDFTYDGNTLLQPGDRVKVTYADLRNKKRGIILEKKFSGDPELSSDTNALNTQVRQLETPPPAAQSSVKPASPPATVSTPPQSPAAPATNSSASGNNGKQPQREDKKNILYTAPNDCQKNIFGKTNKQINIQVTLLSQNTRKPFSNWDENTFKLPEASYEQKNKNGATTRIKNKSFNDVYTRTNWVLPEKDPLITNFFHMSPKFNKKPALFLKGTLQGTLAQTGAGWYNRYNQHIEGASKSYGNIPPDFIKAIIIVESNFIPCNKSPTGACGLMQIVPFTYFDILSRRCPNFVNPPAGSGNWTFYEAFSTKFGRIKPDIFSAAHNIYMGVWLLNDFARTQKRLYTATTDNDLLERTAASFNHGAGNKQAHFNSANWKSLCTEKETKTYSYTVPLFYLYFDYCTKNKLDPEDEKNVDRFIPPGNYS